MPYSRIVDLAELRKILEEMHIDPDSPKTEPEWARVLMSITTYLAVPSYMCNRPPGAAGAVLVGNERSSHNSFMGSVPRLIFGAVEPPVGHSCKDIGCEMEHGHCVRCIHAEVNALLVAAKHGIATRDGSIYSVLKPCYQCTKAIIAAGVRKIYYAGVAYDEERTQNIIDRAGIRISKVDIGLSYGQ